MKINPSKSRTRSTFNLEPLSLMWPDGKIPETPRPGAIWESDLGLQELARGLSADMRYGPYIHHMLAALNTDTEVIAWRQGVLADFIENPALIAGIEALLPRLADLRQGSALFGQRQRNLLLETSDRLGELEIYTLLVHDLHALLAAARLSAPALLHLRDALAQLQNDENFQSLVEELPDLRAPLENIRSLTVGINLDSNLQPVSAALIAIHSHPVSEPRSLLDRLIGARQSDSDESAIAQLHHTPPNPDERPLSPFFRDLDRLMTQTAQPIARSLTRYVKTSSGVLVALENELAFFVAAGRMITRLQAAGIAFCRPEIAPISDGQMIIEGLVNIHLALRAANSAVANDVAFDEGGKIAILTGPNSGGKTTYLRGVGLAQVMFQAGLYLPARAACISPVEAVFTHFPALETRQQGRLAEEAVRLRVIFGKATAHSMVLLNETFSSTSSGEALYLAQDMLAALRVIGVRAIFATHLVELVAQIGEIERMVSGASRLFSLVAGVERSADGRVSATYKITRGEPLGRSYAQEIARQHGISLEQILQEYRSRKG